MRLAAVQADSLLRRRHPEMPLEPVRSAEPEPLPDQLPARRPGGVVVHVRGARPRAVPVLARYHAPLLAAAAFAGPDFLTGGDKPERGNITNPLTRSLSGGAGLPALDTSRLRATWLAETAALTGLATFMHAAGISCCQRLSDIVAGLDPGTEADAIALLTGQAR